MPDTDTKTAIATERLRELRDHPERCANISVRAGRHPWVRYHPGEETYLIVETSGVGRLEVKSCDTDALRGLFAENPVHVRPASTATFSPPESGRNSVWDALAGNGDHVVVADETAFDAITAGFGGAE
jgi:hypothetical protein